MKEALDRYNLDFLAYFDSLPSSSPRLTKAIRYALEAPGKRLRPLFVQDASAVVSLPKEATLHLSFALEMIHLFSLIHDDLPSLDNDDFRRGLPTVHKKFDEGTALLAGDALIALAYETFSKISPFVNPNAFSSALLFFSKCIGAEGMIGGQTLELESAKNSITLDLLLRIQDLKTGALFRAAILTPFYLMGIEEQDPRFQEARAFANDFGFAFQIADDLDDETQDQAAANKNILSLIGREKAIALALEKLRNNSYAPHFKATSLLQNKLSSK